MAHNYVMEESHTCSWYRCQRCEALRVKKTSKTSQIILIFAFVLIINIMVHVRNANYFELSVLGITCSGNNCNEPSGNGSDATMLGQTNWINKTEKKVLIWTKLFLRPDWTKTIQIGMNRSNYKCTATMDRGEVQNADAVLFHYLDLYFWENNVPNYRHRNQTYVLFNAEAPPMHHYVGFLPFKNFFNWTMSYRNDSTVFAPYGDITKLSPREQIKMRKKTKHRNYAREKPKMAVAIVGNCYDNGGRYKLIRELGKYIQIDYYGNCGNLTCPRNDPGLLCTSPKYKFKLSFENAVCKDYATEKFWNALIHGTVPVVNWPSAITNAPPHSYINIFDFPSIKDAADYMLLLSKNETLYNKYFEWKAMYSLQRETSLWTSFSRLCDMLHEPRESQVIKNPSKWINQDVCSSWSVSIS